MSERILIATWAFIFGFILCMCGIQGNPWMICTEAKAKNIVLFSCEKVELP
jgi:hypothetical protein